MTDHLDEDAQAGAATTAQLFEKIREERERNSLKPRKENT
jgi:hypothetical protein